MKKNNERKIMYFRITILTALCFLGSHIARAINPNAPQIETNFFQQASAYTIFQRLDALKIKTFSTNSFIRNGLDTNNIQDWKTLTNAANQFIDQQKIDPSQAKIHTQYRMYAHMLYLMLNEFTNDVASLNEKYKKLYKKPADESQKTILDVGSTFFSAAALKELENIKTSLQDKFDQAKKIRIEALNNIIKNTATPSQWSEVFYDEKGEQWQRYAETWTLFGKKERIINAADLMPDYKKFLSDYKKQKNVDEFMKKYKITDKISAEKTINLLDQIASIMQEKLTENPKDKTRQNDLKTVQEITDNLNATFPDIMSRLREAKFSVTTDKASMILFVQAGAYESVINQFIKEVDELYQAALAKRNRKK